jgi:predicted membrane-bound mannosyltransferase
LQESPVFLLGAIGALVALFKPGKVFALFSALWAFGLIAAYSLIAYKTPWLVLSFIVPLALCGGFAIEWIYKELREFELGRTASLICLGFVMILVTGFMPGVTRFYAQHKLHLKTFIPGYQTLDLNFRNYDNDDPYYVYVYAHTRRDLIQMVNEIDRIAERTHQGTQTGITIVSPEYWPLPWYLRDYTRVGYHGRMAQSTEPVIVASQAQAPEVEAMFGDRYQVVQSGLNTAGTYSLRPGVDLLLYTRRELAK